MSYDYTVLPAPMRAEKHVGGKTTPDRFALTLSETLNEMGARGWEFQRAEALPCEERAGLASKTINTQHVLIFRRPRGAATASAEDQIQTPRLTAGAVEGRAPRLGPAE